MTTYLARLDHLGTLELSGPDSRSFLQGQVTCDVETLDAGRTLPGAYCNPQGRMVCDFRLWQRATDQILMELEADTADIALSTFGRYIVFSKAELRDVTTQWAHYAVWGDAAAALSGAPAVDVNAAWEHEGAKWTAPDIPGCFKACLPTEAAADFEERLGSAEQVPSSLFRELEIRAGIGHVTANTSGEFLPQSLNYQLTGRVSFKKGCYTGQEVVARMHYRGKVKRPALLAEVAGAATPDPGERLYRAGGEQSAGEVVNAVATSAGTQLLLVSVAQDAAAAGVTLGVAGPPLSFIPLPYTVADS